MQVDVHTVLDDSPFNTSRVISQQLGDPRVKRIWSSRVPSKVKICGWLLILRQAKHAVESTNETIIIITSCH